MRIAVPLWAARPMIPSPTGIESVRHASLPTPWAATWPMWAPLRIEEAEFRSPSCRSAR